MRYIKFFSIGLMWSLGVSAWGQLWPPVTTLEHSADLVAIANISGVIQPGGKASPTITLQLQIVQTLKGTPSSTTVIASIAAMSQRAPGPMTFPNTMVGQTGLWFLKLGPAGYQILPRKKYSYSPGELFLPLTGITTSPPATGILDDQLLSYMVLWYRSLDHSKVLDDNQFLSSFEPWTTSSPSQQEVVAAVQPLITSPSVREQLVGLTAELRVGYAAALNQVIANLPAYQSQPQFPAVTTAIGLYPKTKNPLWIAPLQQLASLHTSAPGVDAAAVGALKAVGTKEVLPILAQLLDSQDPQAQLGAASFFGLFSLMGGTDGVVHSGPSGPFANAQTKAYIPRPGSSITVVQYVTFWKNWWSQNQAALGFSAQ